jgi:hypothetical protein
MIGDANGVFGLECEMHNEVTTGPKTVYYRGRYWADTKWSKAGRTGAVASAPNVEVEDGWPRETVTYRRTTDSHPRLVA